MNLKTSIETCSDQVLLSELYALDANQSVLLAEYPSSNSVQTRFRNTEQYIIHDPFPPPRPELLKCLGPHHLMFGWGGRLQVTSQQQPPEILVDHWCRVLGDNARTDWIDFDRLPPDQKFIVLFPHQMLSPDQQIDPEVNYFLHSKQVIGKIDCAQAEIYESPQFPCIAKLSHGYAGLGNYVLETADDECKINQLLSKRWPTAELVYNSIIEDICGDFGVQFYLRPDGTPIWLGFTEQHFDETGRWCGGTFSAASQTESMERFSKIISPVAKYLGSNGYFGVVGIDILQDKNDQLFLVDVNPRLTGITPFLMASRVFSSDANLTEGIYKASCLVPVQLDQLLERVESFRDAKVVVLSAYDDQAAEQTICHLSATSSSQEHCSEILEQLLKT